MVDGETDVQARLGARGYQNPYLTDGPVVTPRRVSFRSSTLQIIFLSALKKWNLWSLDINNASAQADGFRREVFLREPGEWNPDGTRRV